MTRALLAVVVITVAATTAAAALSAAPKRERLTFTGGDAPQSDPCEPLAPHGYFGIDATVVDAIAAFIAATPPVVKP